MRNNTEKDKPIGRPITFDKNEIVKLAMHHFWEHGYDDSSLDDLLLAMNIKKSSFYRTFKSKEELFSACLGFYREEALVYLSVLKKEIGPKATMLLLTTKTINELRDTGKVRGCLLVNSGQECYNKYKDLSNQIRIEFTFMQELFLDFIIQAKELGEIKNIKEANTIARRYMNVLNGLVVTIQAGATQEFIDDIVESLKEMLE